MYKLQAAQFIQKRTMRPKRTLKKIPRNRTGTLIDDVDIWFQDETRVRQIGTVTRTWAIKGSRPKLTRQPQFEYAYIFGAVCSARDEAVGLVLPIANTDAMLVHLKHNIEQQSSPQV